MRIFVRGATSHQDLKRGRIRRQQAVYSLSLQKAVTYFATLPQTMHLNRIIVFFLVMFALSVLTAATPVEQATVDLVDKVTQVFKDPNNRQDCIWKGTSPFCDGGCNIKGHTVRETSTTGDGERCLTGIKVLCCPSTLLNL